MATATKELSGKITKGKTEWYYSTMYYGDEFCHDFTNDSRWAELIYDRGDEPEDIVPSWGGGVVDDGAERAAVVLLTLAHSGYDDLDYAIDRCWSKKVEDRINGYYRQFAKEVVAHLPDNWSMSKAEILKWIEKQEKRRRK